MLTEYNPLHGILIVLFPLNHGVNECVVPNQDDTFTVFLNDKLSDEARIRAYQHALKHILDGDFDKMDVQQIECEAHNSAD